MLVGNLKKGNRVIVQHIAHIVNVALKFQLEESEARTSRIDRESLCVGVDGCNDGWSRQHGAI